MESLPLIERAYTRTVDLHGLQHADTLRREKRPKGLLWDIKRSIKNIIDKGEHVNMYVRCMKSIEHSLRKSD